MIKQIRPATTGYPQQFGGFKGWRGFFELVVGASKRNLAIVVEYLKAAFTEEDQDKDNQ